LALKASLENYFSRATYNKLTHYYYYYGKASIFTIKNLLPYGTRTGININAILVYKN